jgi:hypothetical protein
MELIGDMDILYKHTNGDPQKIKEMYQEAMFMFEMEQRGFYDDDKTADYVHNYITYLQSI